MQLPWFSTAVFVAATITSSVTAEKCNLPQAAEFLRKLDENHNIKECSTSCGYEMSPPSGPPSPDQLSKICELDARKKAFAFVVDLNLPSCTISMLNKLNVREVVDAIRHQCDKMGGSKPIKVQATAPSPAPMIMLTIGNDEPVKTAKPVNETVAANKEKQGGEDRAGGYC
ncbi:TPA: hypothetical protein N0F65_002879 [Lagenidium giganteum]|uniref:Elicitin n=1 Tax=Lagenidium giganteum TaxID=4803 RepID=A0AAV2ZAY6_9STRA|nr:TPA: hypothetical protein N0F65_002879 [Lagenidium giganteum]